MLREILTHPGALLIAISIHLLLVMVFIVSFNWKTPPAAQEIGIPIELIQKIPPLAKTQAKIPKKTVIDKSDTKTNAQTIKNLNEQNITKPVITDSANALAATLAKEKAREEAEKKVEKAKQAKLLAEKKAKEEAEKKAEETKQAKLLAEKKAKEEAEKKAEKAKQAKLLAEKKAKEEAEKKAEKAKQAKLLAEKKAKEEAEKKKRAAAKAKKEARDKKIREAALKKWQEKQRLEKEQKLAAERKAKEEEEKKKQAAILAKEKALQQKIAAEKQRVSAAAKKKAQSDWSNKIGVYVKRRWQIPPGTLGMSAVIRITVSPSGYIRGPIEIIRCSHPSFCDSIKQAYKNSEPLPRPSRNDLDRTLRITMEAK